MPELCGRKSALSAAADIRQFQSPKPSPTSHDQTLIGFGNEREVNADPI